MFNTQESVTDIRFLTQKRPHHQTMLLLPNFSTEALQLPEVICSPNWNYKGSQKQKIFGTELRDETNLSDSACPDAQLNPGSMSRNCAE